MAAYALCLWRSVLSVSLYTHNNHLFYLYNIYALFM
nr:MAG TPA: hypothetical protein [Caudoviricetes sp.]